MSLQADQLCCSCHLQNLSPTSLPSSCSQHLTSSFQDTCNHRCLPRHLPHCLFTIPLYLLFLPFLYLTIPYTIHQTHSFCATSHLEQHLLFNFLNFSPLSSLMTESSCPGASSPTLEDWSLVRIPCTPMF